MLQRVKQWGDERVALREKEFGIWQDITWALLTQPKLLLLDEPSLGLAPLVAAELFEVIQRINQERETTILLVEQNAQLALSIASWGYVMENGQVVLDGPADEVRENRIVREFYLGLNE